MSAPHAVLLVLAGVGGGLAGSVAGLASLVSYPALLALGVAPLTANMTNTVALVFSGAGSAVSARPELAARHGPLRRLLLAAAGGGLVGAVALLVTPAGVFDRVVPWLIAAASVAILVRRPVPAGPPPAPASAEPGLEAATFAIAVYGGYFGAAAGVVLFAVLLAVTRDTVPQASAVKTVLLGVANAVAAVAFIVFGSVSWSATVPLAAGFLLGGWLGPKVTRRVPAGAVRVGVALAGLALAVHLGLDAYR